MNIHQFDNGVLDSDGISLILELTGSSDTYVFGGSTDFQFFLFSSRNIDPFRYSFVLRDYEAHFISGHLEINKGKVSLFIFDSAPELPPYEPNWKKWVELVTPIFPSFDLYLNLECIQRDNISCKLFAINSARRMNKYLRFPEFYKKTILFRENDNIRIFYLPEGSLPPYLMKDSQLYTKLHIYISRQISTSIDSTTGSLVVLESSSSPDPSGTLNMLTSLTTLGSPTSSEPSSPPKSPDSSSSSSPPKSLCPSSSSVSLSSPISSDFSSSLSPSSSLSSSSSRNSVKPNTNSILLESNPHISKLNMHLDKHTENILINGNYKPQNLSIKHRLKKYQQLVEKYSGSSESYNTILLSKIGYNQTGDKINKSNLYNFYPLTFLQIGSHLKLSIPFTGHQSDSVDAPYPEKMMTIFHSKPRENVELALQPWDEYKLHLRSSQHPFLFWTEFEKYSLIPEIKFQDRVLFLSGTVKSFSDWALTEYHNLINDPIAGLNRGISQPLSVLNVLSLIISHVEPLNTQ